MDIAEELKNEDFDKLFNRLTLYAKYNLKSLGIKDFDGKEAVDFVADVFEKALYGIRNWNREKYTFRQFLFGAVQSEILNHIKKLKGVVAETDVSLLEIEEENNEVEQQKNQIIELLMENDADEIEIGIFECWLDGTYKPAVIAEQLQVEVEKIYNGKKRLIRKLEDVKPALNIQL